MPASRKVTTEAVLQAAEEVLREKGFSAVNARNVAEKLGYSTQPIYLCFENMDQLRQALTRRAVEAHTQRVRSFLQAPQDPDHPYSRYSDYGMGFVQFARQEKQLFRWLYLEGDKQKPQQQDVLLPEILETIVCESAILEDFAVNNNILNANISGLSLDDTSALVKQLEADPRVQDVFVYTAKSEDAELNEYLEMLRTRPEMKMMFQLAKGATKEDVEKAVRVIEAMFGKDTKGD